MKYKVFLNSSGPNPFSLKKMDVVLLIFLVFITLLLIIPGFLLSYSGVVYYQKHVNAKAVNEQVVHHEHGSENAHHDKKTAHSKKTHGCAQNSDGNYIGRICTKSISPALLGCILILAGLYLSIRLIRITKS
jgi:hypothetical protein